MLNPTEHIPDYRRLILLFSVILAMFTAIAARLWFLQIVMGAELEEQSVLQRTRPIRKLAPRGRILDANGAEIAVSQPHFVVAVLPDELKKYPDTLPNLALLLHRPLPELEETVEENRTAALDPITVAEDVDIQLLSQIEEKRLDLPGVLILKDPKRFYTQARLYSHLVGLVRPVTRERLAKLKDRGYHGGDLTGVFGLEAQYEEVLRGKEGGQMVEVDAKGRMKRTVEEIAPQTGNSLRLTLRGDLQQIAYDALQEQLAKGHAGAVVALDPADGAVLTLVSSPSYDLNSYGKDYDRLLKDETKPLFNRAIKAGYPCGSPFKLITAAAGLESGALTDHSTDYCPGFLRYGRRWNCDVRSGHGAIGFERAVGASCNVFFWHTAQRMEEATLQKWARNFGIGKTTGIDLPPGEEGTGLIPTPHWKEKTGRGKWVGGDLLNMAVGQGAVKVTPLQLAAFTSALANGGTLLKPQLVREVVDETGAKPTVKKRLIREVIRPLELKPENLAAIRRGMERVVEEGGTAARIRIPGVDIAGKTGTAETTKKGEKAPSHSVFVCFAPVEKPRIAIAVLVENGGFGADTAAPIARRMLTHFFKIGEPLSGVRSVKRKAGRRHGGQTRRRGHRRRRR